MRTGVLNFWGIPRRLWQLLGVLFLVCLIVNLLLVYWGTLSTVAASLRTHPTDVRAVPFSLQANINTSAILPTQVLPQGGTLTTSLGEARENDIVNPHNFNYFINEPEACAKHPELVIMVCTRVGNEAERQTVRETWGSSALNHSTNVTVLFLVGATDSQDFQSRLLAESRVHHDIIQEDFVDSYNNLSLKSTAMLKWVSTFCSTARFLLKSDDDMYINVRNLLTAMRTRTEVKFILGYVFTGARPDHNKNSKWYTPIEQFNEKVYPQYTSGTAYAMTANCASDLYQASLRVPLFWLEDIYITGLCARKAGIPQFHHTGFSYIKRFPVAGCTFQSAISGHRYNISEIRTIHQELMSPNLRCR